MKLSFEVFPNMPWGAAGPGGPAWNSWGSLPLEDCVDRLALLGYDGMDFLIGKVGHLHGAERTKYLRSVGTHARAAGLTIGYIACHSTFVSPNPADRAAGIARFKDGLEAASDVGAESVCTFIGDGFYDPPLSVLMSRSEAWKQCREAVADVAASASELGLNVSLELLQGTILNRVELVERLFDEVDSDNLRLTVDLGTFAMCVRPLMPVGEAIRRLGPVIDVVHLKDEVGFPTLRQKNHIWFGGGLVNFIEVREALTAIDFQGYTSVEWEGWLVGGDLGVGEPAGVGLADFDRVAAEAKEFLAEYDFVPRAAGR
jgi:sugar phosphate isomerase/epimerase